MKQHANTRHGMSSQVYTTKNKIKRWPVYSSWVNMRSRCNNPKTPDYKYYGGRGIKHCKDWGVFESFLEDMGEPPVGYTLDRIDNDKGYSKENCKWSSRKEQSRNRSTSALVTYKGITKPVADWADEITLDIKPKNLYKRIFDRDWEVERAFTQPLKGK